MCCKRNAFGEASRRAPHAAFVLQAEAAEVRRVGWLVCQGGGLRHQQFDLPGDWQVVPELQGWHF